MAADKKSTVSPIVLAAFHKAADRLHHLSMRVVGALLEACTGQQIFMLPHGHPGLHHTRSFIDCAFMSRAEANGLTNLLIKKGIVTHEELVTEMTEQYEYLAQAKAKELGVIVTDYGLEIRNPSESN